MSRSSTTFGARRPAAILGALGAFFWLGWAGAAQGESIVLRVNDAETRPFGQLAVVLRTYEPRPMGQGQVCMRLRRPSEGTGGPLLSLERAIVFAASGDVEVTTDFVDVTQTAIINFVSSDGTVNDRDGPLAVLFFRVAGDAPVGEEFIFEIDVADTELIDPAGGVIPIAPRAGDIEILAPGAPVALEAEGDAVAAGTTLVTGVSSQESQPVAAGAIGLQFDPTIVAGPPIVTMDPRFGGAIFSVDDATPGLLLVSFVSPNFSLNEVPGLFLRVELPIALDAPQGPSLLRIDPGLTYLQAPSGAPIALALQDDVIDVLAPTILFADGFETGDLGAWTVVLSETGEP